MNNDNSLRPKSLASVESGCENYKELAKKRVESLKGMVSTTAQANNVGNHTTLPRAKLKSFRDHPFSVTDDKKMYELAESIKKYGILQNLLIRPSEDGMYEIIAGHRRNRGAEIAGLDDVPVKILNVDDDDAIIIMTFTNMTNRDDILPSEKAKAYKMQKDAFKRQGKRTDLYNDDSELDEEDEPKEWDSSQMVADLNEENRRDIARYIRLTYLIPDLLELVDTEDIAFRPAVELSYLNEEEQNIILEFIASGIIKKITGPKAEELKALSRNKQINETVIKNLFSPDSGLDSSVKKSDSYKVFQSVTKKALKHFNKNYFQDVQIDPDELEKLLIETIKNYKNKTLVD